MTRVRWDSTYGVPLGRVAHHAPRRHGAPPRGQGQARTRAATGPDGDAVIWSPYSRDEAGSGSPCRPPARCVARLPICLVLEASGHASWSPGPGARGADPLGRAEQRPALPPPGVAACAGIGTTRLGGRMHARTHPRAPTYGCGWELEMARACRGVLADDASHAAMSMSKATYQPTVPSFRQPTTTTLYCMHVVRMYNCIQRVLHTVCDDLIDQDTAWPRRMARS